MRNYAESLNTGHVARARTFARAAAALAVLVGALVLVGWALDAEGLKGLSGAITMKANAALALLLTGTSLWLLAGGLYDGWRAALAQSAAALVALIGLATLAQHVLGWNLGIDQLLFTEEPDALATASPGRMGPPASTCFALSGIALLLLHRRRAVMAAQLSALGVALIALLSITGYAYGAESLYGIARFTGIALHTAVALFLLGTGIIAASADRGLAAVIAGEGAGSHMARALLPFALAVPLLLGWIRLRLEAAGQLDQRFGVALLILALIVSLAALIVLTAMNLNKLQERKLAAEAQARDRLSELETIMHVLPVGVLIATDPTATTIRGNRAAHDLLKIPSAEANLSLSAPAGEAPAHYRVFLADGSAARPDDLPVQRAAREGTAVHDVELQVRFHDGTVRHHLVSALPLLDEAGRTRGAVGVIADLTARRAAELEREGLLAEAQEAQLRAENASRSKDEFLATISHELRTPLNAILGWAAMLRDGIAGDEAMWERALATIERNSKAQAQLIEDLLDLSRILSGKFRLELATIDLTSIVHASVDVVRPAADAKEIQVDVRPTPTECRLRADPTRLQQVVWNLLSNAIKFTPRGGTVSVETGIDGGDAFVRVTDNGEGIPLDVLPFVFDRFWQADSRKTRRHGGLGLGLSIALQIAEMHGGKIEASSAGPGTGATFTVRLPLTRESGAYPVTTPRATATV